MTHKFDSGIHDLVCKKLCKYSNFLFVYHLHIWDSSGCLGEKRQTFRKSKVLGAVHKGRSQFLGGSTMN